MPTAGAVLRPVSSPHRIPNDPSQDPQCAEVLEQPGPAIGAMAMAGALRLAKVAAGPELLAKDLPPRPTVATFVGI